MVTLLSLILLLIPNGLSGNNIPDAWTSTDDDFTDYCDMLGQDDINGKKHGFLAGNHVYYMGYRDRNIRKFETIGLTRPFHHDLRSRGTGITYYEGVGTGNDFYGWEHHRWAKVAFGTVITDQMRYENPTPAHMFWRPDKMIVEYELTNPYLEGVFEGWCTNWQQGSSNGDSFWANLSEDECWAHCNEDSSCFQAVYETGGKGQCWIGLNKMMDKPTGSRPGCNKPDCVDKCLAKTLPPVEPVTVREEKFISANDVVSTIITSDRPVKLEISGSSLDMEWNVVTLNGTCSFNEDSNTIQVIEGGRVMAKVQESPMVEKEADLMYSGMTGIISASRALEDVTFHEVRPGVCGYTFSIPLDTHGVTISWTMDDDGSKAVNAVHEVLAGPIGHMEAKTAKMNDLLNNIVPYFRCSDPDIVKIYYFLWSINLMYYTQGERGMQVWPHTQTAVNNFLGLHRYDAVFQILVGSWTSPLHHDFYANGNALAWSGVLPYRRGESLPDNFGIDWASGVYGPETIAHVIGAWQIYEHSGNKTYLAKAYDFYKELFWENIGGKHWDYAYDSVLCLNKMAEVLGFPEDAIHWNKTVGMSNVQSNFEYWWERETPNMYGSTANGMGWANIAPAGVSLFPRDWVDIMASEWMDDSVDGFFGEVPLTSIAMKDWPQHGSMDPFSVVPDANWYMLRGLYLHNVDALANKFTLAHLKKYNMEWGIPVAPEGRKEDMSLFGDSYSNFNAGKILLLLEGIGGISYSMQDDSFTFRDNLPLDWTFMEFHVPVLNKESTDTTWVKARAEREILDDNTAMKTVVVEFNPFNTLIVQPWTEEKHVDSAFPNGGMNNTPVGHMEWVFNSENAAILLRLNEH